MAYLRAARKAEVPSGSIREFQVEGQTIAISNVDGKFYAINNTCLHQGGPLSEGDLAGKIVTCPWHGWQYDVTSGRVQSNPALGVACYAVELRGDEIWVDCG